MRQGVEITPLVVCACSTHEGRQEEMVEVGVMYRCPVCDGGVPIRDVEALADLIELGYDESLVFWCGDSDSWCKGTPSTS